MLIASLHLKRYNKRYGNWAITFLKRICRAEVRRVKRNARLGLFICVTLLGACCDASNNRRHPLSHPAPKVGACITNRSCTIPLISAHRGMGFGAPENSIAAIRGSAALGADIVEIDPQQTADGVFVLVHDRTLTRTTDQATLFPDRANVDELSWSEIQQLSLVDVSGGCIDASSDPERCRVARLDDAFAVARGKVILMLDFKGGDPTTAGALIAAADATDYVLFFNADPAILTSARNAAPGLVTMPRADSPTTAHVLCAAESLPILHVDPSYVSIVAADPVAEQTKLFINIFLEVDMWLTVWQENQAEATLDLARQGVTALLTSGADVVQTNFPAEVADLIEEWRRVRGDR